MARYCPHCGNEVMDQAVVCVRCGCAIPPPTYTYAPPYQNGQQPPYNDPFYGAPYQNGQQPPYNDPFYGAPYPPYTPPTTSRVSTSLILGLIGIVAAWLFALAGHITSIIGIVLGAKEYRQTGQTTGLIVSIIGEACSLTSSILGVIFVLSYW